MFNWHVKEADKFRKKDVKPNIFLRLTLAGNEKTLMDHRLTLADQITNSTDHIKTKHNDEADSISHLKKIYKQYIQANTLLFYYMKRTWQLRVHIGLPFIPISSTQSNFVWIRKENEKSKSKSGRIVMIVWIERGKKGKKIESISLSFKWKIVVFHPKSSISFHFLLKLIANKQC